jgi:acetyl esterase/lipase
VKYGDGPVEVPVAGQAPLLLDLYRPAGAPRPRPVVIFIHGGGFRSGSRGDPEAVEIARGLASRGIVTASIDYRLIGQGPVLSGPLARLAGRVAPAPGRPPDAGFSRAVVAAVEDTLKAIRFMRGHASKYGIDPDRVGLVGGSAGAITADHIAYVLDDYGIEHPAIRFVGSLWGGILIRSANGGGNPASQLETREAALFAVHGESDPTLPVAMSDALVARARDQHIPNEYIRIAGAGHDPPRFFTGPLEGGKTGFERMLDFAGESLGR